MPEDTETQDAVGTGTSSSAETQTETQVSAEASSPSTQETPQSTAGKTLSEVVLAAAEESRTSGEDTQDRSVTAPVPDGTETPLAPVQEEPQVREETPKQPDDQLPFAQHPRWKQVYSERCEFERKAKELESRHEQSKPLVEAQIRTNEFCRQNGITLAQYQDILGIQALINRDPAAAFAKIEPLYQQLSQFAGKAAVLDADLQEAINLGQLNESWARKVQADRAKQRHLSERQTLSQADQARQRDLENQRAVADWDQATRKKDLSFRPSKDGKKGVYELTCAFFNEALRTEQPSSQVDTLRLAEKAYADARAFFATPRLPVGGKPLPNRGSSATARVQPKTLQDVVLGVADGTIKVQH